MRFTILFFSIIPGSDELLSWPSVTAYLPARSFGTWIHIICVRLREAS